MIALCKHIDTQLCLGVRIIEYGRALGIKQEILFVCGDVQGHLGESGTRQFLLSHHYWLA
jgi:hypothetical protein